MLPASVAVYGANGHTGKFVLAELHRRTIPAIAVTRDASRLPSGVPGRVASVEDAAALDRAFAGCGVVINCAGPFLDTSISVVEAALRARCSYLDVTAEQASAQATFANYDQPARDTGVTVMPAAGFYGGLADLLASVLVRDGVADTITTAVALDHWWPTEGTRRTGDRNQVPRMVIEDGRTASMPLPAQTLNWTFAAPHGAQPVVELPFSEVITISRHLSVRSLHSYLTANAREDVRSADTPPPFASDEQGRSAQQFLLEVVVTDARGTRRASASGQDIYAVSAPIVVEAAMRLLAPDFKNYGALALGQAFDARHFLNALAPEPLTLSIDH
ncbi:saccharopine dehydrogenase family protein [Diaphorobacter aerolatus]|uniref:NAD(P)H-binding protein n=1 Tax=Diaphorobacter aerolatus TaxID=1288495 RepID=A0A7H0GH45_9BURK|nr:NAD(P)H-binding protein [Diaphorobacter aerolatus]QNP47611.1 NAD(P)H-binding protein [Diaphorobacter aerolatus]